jgi:hypothetical protein
MRLASFPLLSVVGSPKASIRSICGRRRRCSTDWRREPSNGLLTSWMPWRIVSAGLNGTTQQHDRLLVAAEMELGEARDRYPHISVRIARAQAESLMDISLGFLGMTESNLWRHQSLRAPTRGGPAAFDRRRVAVKI